MSSKQQTRTLWLALIGLVCLFSGAFYVQKYVLPKHIRAVQANLNVPARYAFIADSESSQLAIFDAYDKKLLDVAELSEEADVMSVSRLGGYLAYASFGDQTIYQLDLTDFSETQLTTALPIRQLSVHYGGKWLSYVADSAVVIISEHNGQRLKVATQGRVSLTYHPDGSQLLINELSQGRIRSLTLASGQLETLVDLHRPISPLSVMPNSEALFFVSDKSLYRYSLINHDLQTLSISAQRYRPYVTNDSQTVLMITDEGQPYLNAVNTRTMLAEQRYALGSLPKPQENTDILATGWLDQIAVVAGASAIYVVDRLSGEVKSLNMPHTVDSMLVQSDSKTLLATLKNNANLWQVSLQKQSLLKPIPLSLRQPASVVMGETNTLCH